MFRLMTAALFAALAITTNAQGLSGRRAPSFTLPDHNMKPYDIMDYRGRWLLLDYMNTDCPPCKKLSGILDRVRAKQSAKVATLAVVVTPENTQTVGKYIVATKTTTPIVFDSGQTAMWYFKATPQKPAFDTPHLFVINPQGRIVQDFARAEIEAPGFEGLLERMVAGAPAATK
jgi:peroxiredoxin